MLDDEKFIRETMEQMSASATMVGLIRCSQRSSRTNQSRDNT